MKKRLISILAIIMVFVMVVTGCQSTDTDTDTPQSTPTPGEASEKTEEQKTIGDELEPVVLEWYNYSLDSIADIDMVFDELNEYFEEKINATVNHHFFGAADYKDKMAAIIAGGQELDIAFCNPARLNYVENAQNGAFMAIEDIMYEYAPEACANIPDHLWASATVDGHIYGIPVFKDLARGWEMEFNKTMADAMGIDVTQAWGGLTDLVPLFKEAKIKKDEVFPEDVDIPLARRIFSRMDLYYPYDVVIGFVVANIPGAEMFEGMGSGETAFNIYATDEYRSQAHLMKELVDLGVFPYDAQNYDTDNVLRGQGKIFMQSNSGLVTAQQYGEDFEFVLNISDIAVMLNANNQASIHAISHTSKNPERALMLLNLLNTDSYVADTIRYGIEDVHFNYDEDGAVYFDDSERNSDSSNRSYFQSTGWFLGSIFNATRLATSPPEHYDLIRERDENAITETNLGFIFDTNSVINEIAACNSIIAEYDSPLMTGMLEDVDNVLDDFIAKMDAAGAQKIVDEAQEQLTTWRASVGKSTN